MSIGSEESWKRKLSPVSTLHPASLYANQRWWYSLDQWRYRTIKLATACFSPDCWKLAVPACCYVLQNNLQFVAASHLDVATFQVTYQAKILTTAFFSVVMLNKSLSTKKWACLVALAVGVAIVQLQGTSSTSSHGREGAMDRMTGFVAVVMACITSGFAGVYFEKVLKGSTADLWVRNIQLTLFSLPPALLAALFPNFSLRDLLSGSSVSTAAAQTLSANAPTWLFGNFGPWVMATVFCQVFGGLVTALVIRYSDNIAKGFATSLSIIISFAAGVILFHFQVTLQFLIGCSVVLAATYYYNQPDGASVPGPSRFGSYAIVPSLPQINENDGSSSDSSQSFAVHVSAADATLTKSTVTDRPYPFSEYPNRGTTPPQFVNLAPFSSPKVAPPAEHELSPRSPIPPWSEQMAFNGSPRAMA